MWSFLIFFCLGGYLALLIFLCIFVRKCMDLQYQLEDLRDKFILLDLEVEDGNRSCDPRRGGAAPLAEDPQNTEVR